MSRSVERPLTLYRRPDGLWAVLRLTGNVIDLTQTLFLFATREEALAAYGEDITREIV